MSMVSKQIEQIQYLYETFQYEQLVRYATLTLRECLYAKDFESALLCYGYLAVATHDLGRKVEFVEYMIDYEKVCMAYGTKEQIALYQYLKSYTHFVHEDLDVAIEETKEAIAAAFQIQREDLLAILYGNLSARFSVAKQYEQAEEAKKWALYFSQSIEKTEFALFRCLLGVLLTEALRGEKRAFDQHYALAVATLPSEIKTLHHNQLIVVKAIALAVNGEEQAAISLFTTALNQWITLSNHSYFLLTMALIDHLQLTAHFVSFESARKEALRRGEERSLDSLKNILTSSDFAKKDYIQWLDRIESPLLFRTMQAFREEGVAHLDATQPFQLVAFFFHSKEVLKQYGESFEHQYCFDRVCKLVNHVTERGIPIVLTDGNQGFLLVQGLDFFELETLLHHLSSFIETSEGFEEVEGLKKNIHFGIVEIREFSLDETAFASHCARAESTLYYAETQQRLYQVQDE